MKIIAFYLPQFHCFPENDEWWGKGFTEWKNVQTAKPLFKNHYQPRIPLDKNYYNLLNDKTLEWQAELAQKYGIYGFCYYHYWFNGKMLMEQPMEKMLKNKNIKLPFCICWANENWTKAWAKRSKEILISQNYENKEDWKKHFEYFLKFFQDERYIQCNGKPLLVIYRPELIPCLKELLLYWDEMARVNGLKGISYAYQHRYYNHQTDLAGEMFDYGIEYQPNYAMEEQKKTLSLIIHKTLNLIVNKLKIKQTKLSTIIFDYDKAWKNILDMKPRDDKMIPGAFVDWDNTPRYKKLASVFRGVTPEKFKYYLSRQIQNAKRVYRKDIIFMFAWNEWGEGGYLEPDEKNGYKMLDAIKSALEENDEFPQYP
ncbi:glycoside hydrolase family 99-like domain-containing protein [Clostridium sp. D5]|uniref:glycosyltransferase WbsX family protein n=1 Tax=Clostridium sp. D5 TaxID=556261 RepID=UPI0001FC85DD|nr:glycoside hydrolase family 99-like domain-containing protein [Clostridium sp. D5]EGB90758.1 glycosyl transferase, group 2 family [Clostridium sp. D5]